MYKFNQTNQEIEKVRFLMMYSSRKTLSENIQRLTEQWQSMGGGPDQFERDQRERVKQETAKQEEKRRYTEGCPYPDKAAPPPKTLAGNEGVLKCCCYYPIPGIGEENIGKIQGMYIPRTSEISFWGDIKFYNDVVESLQRKFVSQKLKVNTDALIKQITSIFPPNTVREIVQYDGTVYSPYIKYSPSQISNGVFEKIFFYGFFNENKQPFINQVIPDDREPYQQFIDDWGNLLMWTTAAVTAVGAVIASAYGQEWALPLWAEVFLEGSIGIATGIRQIQKGEDVAGVFSFIFGALPLLKYSNYFKGYDPKHFDELAKAFQKSKLSSSSHVSQYVSFYNKLNKPQREILDKILRGGDIQGKTDLIKKLTQEAAEKLPGLLEKGFVEMWKKNPKLFVKIPLFERLWARELSTNAVNGIAAYLTTYMKPEWSRVSQEGVDPNILDQLDGVYENIPEELKKEMGYYLISDPERAIKFLSSKDKEEAKKISQNAVDKNSDNVSKGLIALWGKKMKKVSDETGSSFTPLSSDLFTGEKMTVQQLDELKKRGYIEKKNLDWNQKYDSLRYINNIYYVKPTGEVYYDEKNSVRN